jgi:mRNA interferase YafQ
MYELIYTSKIKKDIKLCKRRKYDFEEFKIIIEILESKGELPLTYKPHKLSGTYSGRWECHIKPDWLLIWKQNESEKEIYLERTGTHSDLF